MGRGRPPKPGTIEEKAAARRERVRNNVRALRERRKREASLVSNVTSADEVRVEWRSYHEGDQVDGSGRSSNTSEAHKDSDTVSVSSALSDDQPGELLLVCRRDDTQIILPTKLDDKSPYTMALLATMRQNFLPDAVYLPPAINSAISKPWESDQFLWTPCAFWVTTAFAKASSQETGLLKNCLLAIGMIMKGIEFQDASLRIAALEMYRRSLSGIRKSLEPLIADRSQKPKDPVSLYLSCHAAAMFELIQNSDLSATMQHLRGVSQLICHLGDGRDEDGQSIAWLLLQDYRFAEMGLCLKYRYSSISSVRRQQFEEQTFDKLALSNRSSLAYGHGSHNLLVKITDIADRVSATMVRLDGIRHQLHRPNTANIIRRGLDELNDVWNEFHQLLTTLRLHYGTSFYHKDIGAEGPAPGSVKFKNFDVGAAWCYNLMTQAYCLDTSIDAATLLLQIQNNSQLAAPLPDNDGDNPETGETVEESVGHYVNEDRIQELRKLHRAVCIQLTQCLQYFLQTDKGITGQALAIFPLDAAIGQLELELARLQTELQNAKESPKNGHDVTLIEKNLASLLDAKDFCRQLQERAREFGLPSFSAAGTEAAHKLRSDDVVVGSSVDSEKEQEETSD